ncbi:MAG: ribosome recycling factor [Saprospiraceae bacterium]|nr:ribosome recycling factor [Bacteroidia bacterium]NNE13595.1 ribosome recycling factor [Saprospiraceae bacterium]NNL92922.1 ribosome recycling factor [Saprospiraceae bacterium]
MSDLINAAMSGGKSNMDKAINHLKDELLKLRTGKASGSMLKGIMVDYYGTPTALHQAANVSTPDSKTISIQPWDKKLLGSIEQAIFAANLGLTPMNDGEFVRITIPPLTEERRKELVKVAKSLGEDSKVSIRNERQKILQTIKAEVKNGYPEDQGKRRETEVQNIVNGYGDTIGKLIEAKEKDIMTV